MKCEHCGIEYPHKKGRFCGACTKSPREDVRVQIERDCSVCGGMGCHACKGTGCVCEWINLVEFQKMLIGAYRPV
jgi:hypothetical protein